MPWRIVKVDDIMLAFGKLTLHSGASVYPRLCAFSQPPSAVFATPISCAERPTGWSWSRWCAGAFPETVREAGKVAVRGHDPGTSFQATRRWFETALRLVGVVCHIRVRQTVLARQCAVPYLKKVIRMVAQTVADVVQAQRMG